MVDYEPKLDKNITFFYVLLAFVIIAIITFIILTATNAFDKTRTQSGPTFQEDYFVINDPWGEVSNQSVNNQLSLKSSVNSDPTGSCNVYTYENLYEVATNPNLKNLFNDYLTSLCHLDVLGPCLDADQVYAVNSIHTCKELSASRCIAVSGEIVPKGATEIFTRSCAGNKVPECIGKIGSLSFNFIQDQQEGLVNSKVKVLEVNRIYVSQNQYDDIDKVIPFYTREAGLFIPDPRITNNDFEPIFVNSSFREGNFKQRLKLDRYNVENGDFVESELGPYASIIFRPYNLFLDIDEIIARGQIFSLKFENNFNDNISENYNYLDPLKRRKVIRQNTPTDSEDAFCFLTIGQLSLNQFSVLNLSFTKRGTHFEKDEVIKIEPDETGDYTFGTEGLLEATVSEITSNNTRITLKRFQNKSNTIAWMLIPPLDLNQKVWPQTQRGEFMNGLSVNSKLLFYDNLFDPNSGAIKNTKTGISSCEEKAVILNYAFIGPVSRVSKGTIVNETVLNLEGRNEDLPENFPDAALIQKVKQTQDYICKIDDGNSEAVEFLKRTDIPPRYLYKAINPAPGFVSENEDFNFGLLGFKKDWSSIRITNGYRNYIIPFNQEKYQNLIKTNTVNVPVRTGLIGKNGVAFGDRIVDNEVIWLVIDPFSLVSSFTPPYYLDSFDVGSAVTNITGNNTGGGIYKSNSSGRISSISVNNDNYNGGGKVGVYIINLENSDVVTFVGENTGTNGTFYLSISIDEETKTRRANPPMIGLQGEGYENDAVFNISFEGIEITGLKITTFDSSFIYSAVPQGSDGIFYPDGGTSNVNISKDGFTLRSDQISIVDGFLTIADENLQEAILSGGYGYNEGDVIYVNQIDTFGTRIVNNPNDVTNLFSIRVSEVSTINYSPTSRAPSSLLSPTNGGITREDVSNNFFIGTLNNMEESPPQIAYVKDILGLLKTKIKTNSTGEFINLFNEKNNPSSIGTRFDFIKTLQFRNLNFKKTTNLNESENNISYTEELILGRFIPTKRINIQNEFNITTDKIYNNNYPQFIPYGIGKLYNKYIRPSELPTF